MKINDKAFETHSLYNLSRYLYLKLESDYSNIVEKSNITLPQLRVLWIIKAFPGISLGKIARLGCWSPPTVTNILKILIEKHMVYKEESTNKKLYKLNLTDEGEKFIFKNRQGVESKFILYKLINLLSEEELNYVLNCFKLLTVKSDSTFIFDYVERVNTLSLKINYDAFNPQESNILKSMISLENMLRIFVLKVEHDHSNFLKKLNLTYPQIRALWILEAFPGITSSDLSQLGFWSPSTANLVVRNLYSKNLIYKVKGGIKNSLYLYVSDEGGNLLLRDIEMNEKNLDIHKILEEMSPAELNKLNSILNKMNIKLGNNMLDAYIKKTFKKREDMND